MIRIKSQKELELMRRSGKLAARILKEAAAFTRAGISTNQINNLVHELTLKNNAYPSTLNYRGYPKSVCTSINNVVTHGIPSDEKLKNGDIVNIDVTCNLDGYHGDTSSTLIIGEVPSKTRELVEVTQSCLEMAIDVVRPGIYLNEVGNTIQGIADSYGFSVVQEYCGHGIGRNFHEDPLVLHYRSRKKSARLAEGMVFTIEPMINLGEAKTKVLADGWTVVTVDGSLSAQFEHTIAVTRTGAEILTEMDA